MSQPDGARPARSLMTGVVYGLFCVLCWGGYLVVARMGAVGLLQGPEQASLRAIGSGLVLLPRFMLVRRRLVAQQGWPRLIAICLLVGPLYLMLFVQGMVYAPASHAGVITPSSVAVLTTLLAWWWLGEAPPRTRILGLLLVVAGVVAIGWDGISGAYPGAWRGMPFFLAAAVCYASYTVLVRRWRIGGMDATTVLAVLSLPYVPLHALWRGARLLEAPWQDLMLQLVMQGLLTGVLATVAFAQVIWLLGPASAGAIGALVPVMATLLGWAILGEQLGPLQLCGMTLAVVGVLSVVLLPAARRT
ncbi:MAG: DMT family transporter [Acetobacteraceae bacterium]|nr:DMT family transporter [Acetobacteraceae bacterium]